MPHTAVCTQGSADGRKAGWGGHAELQHLHAVLHLVTQSCLTLCDPTDCGPPGSSVHGESPGNNTGVSCCALLQRLFPTQGLKPGLSPCKQILYYLSHQGSPRIREWVADPFSRGSSWPRNWTRVSCTAGRFLISFPLPGKPRVSLTTVKRIYCIEKFST